MTHIKISVPQLKRWTVLDFLLTINYQRWHQFYFLKCILLGWLVIHHSMRRAECWWPLAVKSRPRLPSFRMTTPYNVVEVYRRFRAIFCLHHVGRYNPTMKAAGSYKTSVRCTSLHGVTFDTTVILQPPPWEHKILQFQWRFLQTYNRLLGVELQIHPLKHSAYFTHYLTEHWPFCIFRSCSVFLCSVWFLKLSANVYIFK